MSRRAGAAVEYRYEGVDAADVDGFEDDAMGVRMDTFKHHEESDTQAIYVEADKDVDDDGG